MNCVSPASEFLVATDEESKHALPSLEKNLCPVFVDSLGMDEFLHNIYGIEMKTIARFYIFLKPLSGQLNARLLSYRAKA